MKTNNMFLMMTLGAALAVPAGIAQDEAKPGSEVSVQAVGGFSKSTTKDGIEQSATNTGGILASYRYYFNRHNGVELNYGFLSNNEQYRGIARLENRTHEVSAAYVFRFPMRRITPFALAGVGGLVFDPKNFAGADYQGRAAFVYGGGADINFSRHIFVRAEYRGLVYNSPTYNLPGLNGIDRVTHLAEPSVGFGYRF